MIAAWHCCIRMPLVSSSMPSGQRRPAIRIQNLAPYSKFQTRTCEIFVAAGNDPAFRKFCELLDMPDMASDPRFATKSARLVHRDALTKKLNARFSDGVGYKQTHLLPPSGLPPWHVRSLHD